MEEAHLCVVELVCPSRVLVEGLWVRGELVLWARKPLFSMMSRMVSDSLLCSSFCRLYVFSLLWRNRMAAYLCWDGCFEEYGMIVSVEVGFLYTEVIQFVGVLWMVISR